jgi:thioredoxin-like negative regulator of GroEL
MLFRLGVEPSSVGGEGAKKNKPLAEADRLRTQGNLTQAEVKLTDLLKQEPSNQAAALMLMRLYAEDRQRRDLAEAELSRITNQRHIPPAFIEYARRSIAEWSAPRAGTEDRDDMVESLPLPHPAGESPSPTAPAAAVSVDELIANGCLGTAIERLEEELKERPNDFDLWLKLAEAQAVHCGNLSRAGKIVERLKTNPAFTSEQVQQAQAKLKEWKVGRGSH